MIYNTWDKQWSSDYMMSAKMMTMGRMRIRIPSTLTLPCCSRLLFTEQPGSQKSKLAFSTRLWRLRLRFLSDVPTKLNIFSICVLYLWLAPLCRFLWYFGFYLFGVSQYVLLLLSSEWRLSLNLPRSGHVEWQWTSFIVDSRYVDSCDI